MSKPRSGLEWRIRSAFMRWHDRLLASGSSDPEGEFMELLHDELPEGVKLGRCSYCHKWSHAKRMPRHHRRFIENEDDALARDLAAAVGLRVLEEVEPSWNGDPDHDGNPGGVWVACGPFLAWTATPDD